MVSDCKLAVSQVEQVHGRSEELGSRLPRKNDENREPYPKEQVTDTTVDYRATIVVHRQQTTRSRAMGVVIFPL
jgi:hypothetical protein